MRLAVLLLAFLLAAPAWAERVALVLGNGAYRNADPLRNAANDARDMAARLRALGYDVHEGIDLPRAEALRMVQDFARGLRPFDTALFYYAGHGMQIGADNYIMPVDAAPGSEGELIDSSIRLQSVLATMEGKADTRIVILDACRNNPFLRAGSSRSTGAQRGFMKMEAGVGSFIAYSTEPGAVAADGAGRNSPFTEALLRHIGREGDNIHAVMRRVRADVMNASNNAQIPWENSALIDEVFLTAAAPPRDEGGASDASQAVGLSARPVTPAPQVARVAPATQPTHMVSGLDPNGDGFLALRAGPTSSTRMLMMLTEGTPLDVMGRNGDWMQVRTPEGLQGWAHSNWIRQTAAAPVQTVRPSTPFTHRVGGLDPGGDGFLALREGTWSGARRLAQMGDGTQLAVLAHDGPWWMVRTETGLQGWAHSNWIRPLAAAAPAMRSTGGGESCDALWHRRNAFFAAKGYCFQGARGQAAFGNAGCNPALAAGDVPLSNAERSEIARIQAQEQAQGCR